MEKWPILKQNFGKKLNFSTFSTPCFYSLKPHFFALKYHKTHFPGLNCLNKKHGKMANFRQKRWTNLFKNKSIFRLSQVLVFIA